MEEKTKKLLNEKVKRAEGMLSGLFLSNPELYLDYTIKPNLLSEEAQFYIGMVNRLLKKGIEVIDEITFVNDIEDNQTLMDKYEKMGGYKTIKELQMITDVNNADAIVDEWQKWNLAKRYSDKGILDLDIHIDKINRMNCDQLYKYMEHEVNDISVDTGLQGLDFENLIFTEEELQGILDGDEVGLQFGSKSPILNGMSLGVPKGELNSISSYINEGKTSFAFSNFVMPIVNQGHKVLIISTEQRSKVFKLMLLTDIMTNDLNYFKLTRKKLKSGKWTDEDKIMIKKAVEISKEKYGDKIVFLKLYDYNTDKVTKSIKKYAQVGVELVLYDVLKFSESEEQVWKSLIDDSKDLFQCCSKFNVAGLVTLQLQMGTKNKVRQIGMECVSMSKQVFEVMSECYFIRSAWEDELDEESPYYLKPYRLKRDSSGKFTSEKEEIKLNKDKIYKIIRLGKSRNDGTDKFLLYQVDFNYNIWKELGFCHVSDKNRY